jgi:hypothetical protein
LVRSFHSASENKFLSTPPFKKKWEMAFSPECPNAGLPISCAKGTVYIVVTESGTVLYAKVLLQGALIAPSVTIMRNDINTLGYLPLSSPYANSSNPRFTNVNGGTATTTPAVLNANINTPNGIVDWVFLEVRSNTTSAGVIQTISALVQRDGDIVDSMGNPLVLNIPGGNYYLSVKHRNHIGALTKNPILFSGQVDTIDFITMPNSAIFATPLTSISRLSSKHNPKIRCINNSNLVACSN